MCGIGGGGGVDSKSYSISTTFSFRLPAVGTHGTGMRATAFSQDLWESLIHSPVWRHVAPSPPFHPFTFRSS